MNHLRWMGHTSTILEIQRNLFHDTSSCDITISCGGKYHRVHRFILSSCSDYFRDILADAAPGQDVMIIIPDLKECTLENVLSLIYLGEVSVRAANLTDFLAALNLLGIKSAISFDCHLNKRKVYSEFPIEEEPIDVDKPDEEEHEQEESAPMDPCTAKDFDYLEVYNEGSKIGQFTIEHIEQDSNGDYILAENSENSYPLTDEKAVEAKPDSMEFAEEVGSDEITEMKEEEDDKSCDDKDTQSLTDLLQSRNDAFAGAVRSVIEDGMSLQKAATKFNISKTVLWRRVKKHPQYRIYRENPVIVTAIEKLQKGESLKSISVALDIPMSTLHRHKMRLLQEGRLPEHVQVKKRDSKETLKIRLSKAVEACHHGMSQNHAANVFGVPKSTLWRHLQKQKTKTIDGISLSLTTYTKDVKSEVKDDII